LRFSIEEGRSQLASDESIFAADGRQLFKSREFFQGI
jgi:hypothetical protein